MIGGIKNVLAALKPVGSPGTENTMITTETKYHHLILIDYKDHSTGYQELDSLREAHLTAEDLKQGDDIAYFRVRLADGTEICWENPNKEEEP